MRGLILALQFLTRLPTPRVPDFRPEDLAASAAWFPVVGAAVGAVVAVALVAGAFVDAWLGALAGLMVWVWITGALHLDGLADLADALGAAHRDPQRVLEVLRDPHIGTFGVVAIVLVLAAKLVLLAVVAKQLAPLVDAIRAAQVAGVAIPLGAEFAVPVAALGLVGAWARFGAVVWSQTLPPLASGSAERFAWRTRHASLVAWAVALIVAAVWLFPPLAAAPLAVALWWAFLKRRLGGMTGDCLGAGIEVCETVLLAVVAVGLGTP
ncbi:MAG TPA: adenosylcobinamide-GDP ribazoletransferase [Burkholderiales bacterium]|nr:adenosylcobinamide-GDP ribazoletransferase [Burkholderiales bacterium]